MAVKDPEKPLQKSTATDKPQEKSAPAGGESEAGKQVQGRAVTLSETTTESEGKRVGKELGEGKTSAPLEKRKPADEDQQVKAAARELAKNMGGIRKIKVCYVDKDDEWWATLYEDIGTVIDVKQFFWNRESEKFEPFLILKRISKSKLDGDLKHNEPGRKCAVVVLPEAKDALPANHGK
jgi:hypothetical protein